MSVKRKLQNKYKAGEISKEEYEEILSKLDDLGLVSGSEAPTEGSDIKVVGSKRVEGGKYGKVIVSGKFSLNGNLSTNKLKVSGKGDFSDDLNVDGEMKISGKVNVGGKVAVTSDAKISGSLQAKSDIISSGVLMVSGKVICGGDLVSDNLVKVSGKIESKSIQSTGKVVISGKIETAEDIVADNFNAKFAGGQIGGKITAKTVLINYDERDRKIMEELESEEINKLDDFPSLARYLVKTFKSIGSSSSVFIHGKPPVLTVKGGIEGDSVTLDNAVIVGDVIGKEVIIGENTEITGTVRFSSSIHCPEKHTYNVEMI